MDMGQVMSSLLQMLSSPKVPEVSSGSNLESVSRAIDLLVYGMGLAGE